MRIKTILETSFTLYNKYTSYNTQDAPKSQLTENAFTSFGWNAFIGLTLKIAANCESNVEDLGLNNFFVSRISNKAI
jgi:hypothetical protein